MTKDELKQEAEEKLLQAELDYCHELSNPCEPSELPYSELLRFETGYKRGYLAGAEPREKRIAELEKELEQAKKVQVVEHFEAYGQCRDSRRIASLEKENEELKDKLNNLASVAEVRLANWQKYEKENAELKEKQKWLGSSTKCWFSNSPCRSCDEHDERLRRLGLCYTGQLTKAKELIRDVLTNGNYNLNWKVKAEQFLKECE